MKLYGKNSLIIGGTTGIGLSIAQRFMQEGSHVAVCGHNPRSVSSAQKILGPDVLSLKCDVQNLPEIHQLISSVVTSFKTIDVLIYSAGVFNAHALNQITPEEFDLVFSTNYRGAFFTIQTATPHMPNGASIVLISAMMHKMGLPGSSIYAGSKAALRSLARTASADLLDRHIRVNVISPGPIDTPMIAKRLTTDPELKKQREEITKRSPSPRMGMPGEVASAALYLCSLESQYIVGEELTIDGGWSNLTRWT